MKKIFLILLAITSLNLKAQNLDQKIFDTAIKNEISEIVDDISRDSIASYITQLVHYGSRFELLENRYEISEWIKNKFESFGYTDVQFDSFDAHVIYNKWGQSIDSTYEFRNVLCTSPGVGASDEKFILCAHYDSYSSNTNPMITAPGADDNASGVASLLEIARVLKLNNKQLKRTVVFAALAGEELMLRSHSGSKHYAQLLLNNNEDVKLVINHDMIGYTNKPINESSVNINRHIRSLHFADLAKISVEDYTLINANHTDYFGADLGPFFDAGYHGVYFEESIFNPFYHTDNDLLSNMNSEYCAEVIKGSCALTIWSTSMPNIVEGINVITIEDIDKMLQFSWRKNHDFDFDTYVLYLSQDNGSSFQEFLTTDTLIVVDEIEDFNKVRYAVAARSTDGYESFAEIYSLVTTNLFENLSNENSNFKLYQNYPNPFNPATNIEYSIPQSDWVTITIYDVLGNKVTDLVRGYKTKGSYAIEFDGSALASGIYLCQLNSGKFSATKKLSLIK